MKVIAGALCAIFLSGCPAGNSDAGGGMTPQSACEAFCTHALDAGCTESVQQTAKRGGCAQSCAASLSTPLKPGCESVYISEQQCFANATITCDARGSVTTSLAASCLSQNQAFIACERGTADGGTADAGSDSGDADAGYTGSLGCPLPPDHPIYAPPPPAPLGAWVTVAAPSKNFNNLVYPDGPHLLAIRYNDPAAAPTDPLTIAASRYDENADQWSAGTTMSFPSVHKPQPGESVDGESWEAGWIGEDYYYWEKTLYAFTGTVAFAARYSWATDTWTALDASTLPSNKSNMLWMAGGRLSNGTTSYDPATGQWTDSTAANPVQPMEERYGADTVGGRIVAFDITPAANADFPLGLSFYDPVANNFTASSEMGGPVYPDGSSANFGAFAKTFGSNVMVGVALETVSFTGFAGNQPADVPLYRYDTVNNAWSPMGYRATWMTSFKLTPVGTGPYPVGDKLVLPGFEGNCGRGSVSVPWLIADTVSGIWATIPRPPVAGADICPQIRYAAVGPHFYACGGALVMECARYTPPSDRLPVVCH